MAGTTIVDVESGNFLGRCLARYRAPFATRILTQPLRTARAGRVLRDHRRRVTARVDVEGMGPLLLKVHDKEGGLRGWFARWRATRGRAEWEAARFLEALGAPVAAPLGYAEDRAGWVRPACVFAGRYLERHHALVEALPGQPWTEAQALLDRSAHLVRALHDHGFDHLDLHAGNLLAARGPGSRAGLVVVDVHRSAFPRHVSRQRRRRAVSQWLHALAPLASAGRCHRWLVTYLQLPSSQHRDLRARWYAATRRAALGRERRRLRSRGKRCCIESTVFTADLPKPWQGWRRRALSAERLEAALAGHDEALAAADGRLLKSTHKSRVTSQRGLIVKEALSGGHWGGLRTRLAPGRHAAGYRHAHQLEVRGIATATPQAYVQHAGRALTVYTDLRPRERLDFVVLRLFRRAAGERLTPAARRFLYASADWVAHLHGTGVYHGDLKAVNVLVDERVQPPVFHLIDTDRVVFSDAPVGRRRVIKNLAQLAASLPRCVSRSDRLRWFRRYAAGRGSPGSDAASLREFASALNAHLKRRRLVVDEPFE